MKKIKKKILAGASSGILASMLILGAGNAHADTANETVPFVYVTGNSGSTGMHMMHRFNSVTKINSLALQLGLDPQEVRAELQGGKTIKQILLDHDITGVELEKAFGKNQKGWRKNASRDTV